MLKRYIFSYIEVWSSKFGIECCFRLTINRRSCRKIIRQWLLSPRLLLETFSSHIWMKMSEGECAFYCFELNKSSFVGKVYETEYLNCMLNNIEYFFQRYF